MRLARLPLSLSVCRGGLRLPQARCQSPSASLALPASLQYPRTQTRASPQFTSPSTLSLDRPSDTRAQSSTDPCASYIAAFELPLTLSSLSRNLSAPTLRPPPRRARPRKPRPHAFSSVYAPTPRTSIPLRRPDAPPPTAIGLRRFAALAEPLLTAKQAFLCHHHHLPVETLAPLRTPVRCRPFQPSGAIQQPSRHATQARRRIRHLNLSPPTTTPTADVIA